MGATKPHLTAACPCGRTAIEVVGAPILTAVCCCESCQTAGRQFEMAPGAPPVVRTDGGTAYCLYRKDRVRVALGGGDSGGAPPDAVIPDPARRGDMLQRADVPGLHQGALADPLSRSLAR